MNRVEWASWFDLYLNGDWGAELETEQTGHVQSQGDQRILSIVYVFL